MMDSDDNENVSEDNGQSTLDEEVSTLSRIS